ncbi:hypothetical protein [Sinorhizobium sp. NFACC03]|uniref:hypothetical protein n=1 Tax=Sinorhizobium sp. NFACC03 TaxID=1566295 RepID=UPI0008924A24|nr:hypothetical protein [Sinorhizobium sp. NFACC03]SDA93651.1 hypothetical protein SAMN03159448_05025 [Sinorhizobium sp. NFACC03]
MLKSGLIVFASMALGVSAAIAGVGTERTQTAQSSPGSMWAANEVHALYDPAKRHAPVDVNEKFSIKSRNDGDGHRM